MCPWAMSLELEGCSGGRTIKPECLLNAVAEFEGESDRLGLMTHQLDAKCRSQRVPAVCPRCCPCSWRADELKTKPKAHHQVAEGSPGSLLHPTSGC